jgi:hypothetical protein
MSQKEVGGMTDERIVQQERETGGKEMNVVQRIMGVFFSPKKVFEYLREKPSWLVPFMLICVIAVISNILVRDFAIQEQIERVQMSQQLTDEQKDQIVENMQKSATGGRAMVGTILTPVFILIMLIVVSALFLFSGNTIFGGQACFGQVLGMYAHAGLIAIPAAIVKIPIMLIKQSTKVQTSLAAVMPSGTEQSLLYRLLAKVDIFTIWELILVIIGISVIYRFTNKKAATLVLVLWAIWIAISLALGSLLPGFGLA